MKFNLAKIHTVGLTYIDDGQITNSCIENGFIINGNVVFKKPYRIQVRVSKMVDGKRLQNKRVFTFSPDIKLFTAIKECNKHYETMMNCQTK